MRSTLMAIGLFWAAILLSGATPPSWADTVYNRYLVGEGSYQKEEYDKALNSFIDAQIESPENALLKYNIANAHYKTRNYDEAIKSYLDVAATAKDVSLEEKSYYNLGNCLYRQGKLPEAVEYYKKALELDPEDQDAKYNLEFVREEIKRRMNEAKNRQEEQQRTGQPQDQPRDQRSGEEKSGAEEMQQEEKKKKEGQEQDGKPEGSEKEQTSKQGAGEEKSDEPKRQEDTKSVAQKKKMSPEEAERWLRGLPDDQREIMKKQLERQFGGEYSPEKDW